MTLPQPKQKKPSWILGFVFAASMLGSSMGSGVVLADDLKSDARLEAYSKPNAVLDVGVASYYILLAALGLVGVTVMFKDAKRMDAKKG